MIDAIRRKLGKDKDRAIVMLHLELGANVNAIIRIRRSDLIRYEINTVENGQSKPIVRYHVALPRVKKGTELRETVTRPISLELGELLERLSLSGPDSFLLHWLDTDDPEREAAFSMKRFSRNADLRSNRTGELLRLSPRRFRYTLGTEMAAEGASKEKIAAVLDHTDLQNVDVYVEASSYIVRQLGQRFDDVFEPIAKRFRGRIIDESVDQPEGSPNLIPSIPVHLNVFPIDLGGIGSCGRDLRRDGLCQLAPPLTCYPCEFFAAFRNGPHKEVLTSLKSVQAELHTTSDTRIAMQIAGVIDAVEQLVVQIENEAGERD